MSEPDGIASLGPAERHRSVARRFGVLVDATRDWNAPTPVAAWETIDIVAHLIEWFPAFLAAGGVRLPTGPSVSTDASGAWRAQTDAVQGLLDDQQRATEKFTHPMAGTHELSTAIDRFYTADVFMHTWDLARATNTDPNLDPGFCTMLVDGMESIDELLRSSGQYGPRVTVPDDSDPMTRLIGFIGRDPNWQPAT